MIGEESSTLPEANPASQIFELGMFSHSHAPSWDLNPKLLLPSAEEDLETTPIKVINSDVARVAVTQLERSFIKFKWKHHVADDRQADPYQKPERNSMCCGLWACQRDGWVLG